MSVLKISVLKGPSESKFIYFKFFGILYHKKYLLLQAIQKVVKEKSNHPLLSLIEELASSGANRNTLVQGEILFT